MTENSASRRQYQSGDLAVTVTARDQGPVADYLSGYLAGPAGTHQLPAYQISLHAGPGEPARAAARIAGTPVTRVEPVPGVVLSAASGPGGSRVFTVTEDHLEHAPGTWTVSITGTRIDLHVDDPARGPRHVLRIIRELMLRAYEDAGAVVFHAAGVEVDGGAVMICGPLGAGKTTAAAAILHQFGPRARMLSNDRILTCDGQQAIGVPLPVPVAAGTLGAFPALRAAASAARRERPGEPDPDTLPARFGTAAKIAFPARTFTAAFGAGLAATSRLTAIIFPALTDDDRPAAIRRAAPAEAEAALAACCFTPADEFWRPWLVPRARSEADLAAAAARRRAELASSLPCVAVSSGVRRSPGELGEALATVTGTRR